MSETKGDWASERISMTHLGNLSRSSNYVRSLVRQQFHQQSDQPAAAWARLRERLAKTGQESFESIDSEEGFKSFIKKKQSEKTAWRDSDGLSGDEDEEEEEETYVYLKTASPEQRFSKSVDNKINKAPATSPPSSRYVPSPSTRRLSAPQTPFTGMETQKKYTIGSTDAHSQILNRRLSLAENVIKNYSKYIRTPDVDQKPQRRTPRINIENEGAGTEREQTSEKPSIVAITEEESSALTDVELVDRDESPVVSSLVSYLAIPQGSSYTVPPSPADENEKTFLNGSATLRRNSFAGMFTEELSFHRSGTDTTSKATTEKLSSDTLPRISQTSQGRRRRVSANSREEAIKELKKDHKKLAKNKLLKQRKKDTFYQQLKRDQEKRALRSEIFNREMEDIRKELKGINSRLDERIEILDCHAPPKVNVKLHRILQVALAGIPFSK